MAVLKNCRASELSEANRHAGSAIRSRYWNIHLLCNGKSVLDVELG